ncbi:MAG TPA: MptD family putative ECF transporter S component [Lachnospiraceae bacterium]|nr:MptD family putative ECF transporter S component [Lachnospiraceae bacterium]
MNSKKMNVKDLIVIGILSTIAIVCYAIAVIVSCTTVIGLFFSTAVAFAVMGTVYMLIALKVQKRGTFFLCGAVMSLVGLFGGRIFTTIGCIAGGLIAELIVGQYKKFSRIAAAYAGYAVTVAAGIYMPGFIIGTDYLLARGEDRGMTAESVKMYEQYFNMNNLFYVLLLNAVAALLGAYIGKLILNKHFVKARLIEGSSKYKVFPWWKARLFSGIQFMRRKRQNPEEILKSHVTEDIVVADIGCGMGYFTIPMVKMIGKEGKVIAIDLQEEMLLGLKKRAEKEHCEAQILLHNCEANSLKLEQWKGQLSFVLLFAVAHEVPDRNHLFNEIHTAMKDNGKLLFAEPAGHVDKECFEESIRFARENGFEIVRYLDIKMSRAVLLQKKIF